MFRSVEKFVLRNISLWNLLKEAAKYGILKKIVCDLGVRAHKLGKVRRFKCFYRSFFCAMHFYF